MAGRILLAEQDANKKGDLFNERMGDILFALGYEVIRVNVHKPGREIDITAKHRIEERQIRAECKAHKTPISGADLNKFAGVLQVERESDPEISGYFISISGFKDSALTQEDEFRERRFQLLGPREIRQQLVKGRVICSEAEALAEVAKHPQLPKQAKLDTSPDLIAHDSGWVWLVRSRLNSEIVATAFVHANGQLLTAGLAQDLQKRIAADLAKVGILSASPNNAPQAEERYRHFVAAEYGSLTLEGVPVDKYTSVSVHRLEDLYVPMRVEDLQDPEISAQTKTFQLDSEGEQRVKARRPVADILASNQRIAILANPGSGKSTLVKRLAVAYAKPERRAFVDDSLPDKDWLPIVIRGRDIRTLKEATILDIIYDIPHRAEFPWLDEAFRSLVNRKLQTGQVLLLVDGLDEISEESSRKRFAQQLRTFAHTNPLVRLVLTSREAGYRAISGSVGSYCDVYQLSEFSDEDITSLTHTWFREISPSRDDAKKAASDIVQDILENDRVRQLATNPLLLTTLLYVQRWVGEIPRRRVALYDKAIELLLMTWNVEGHAPINLDDTLPQLAFLAYDMTVRGEQRISESEINEVLGRARSEIPEVLAYSTVTPTELIRRVELRSSLIMHAGHEFRNGRMSSLYEFRHLTFQEYLTALAIAEEWCPESDSESPLQIISAHFAESSWSEVIVLCATLLGRRGSALVSALCDYLDKVIDEADVDLGDEEARFTLTDQTITNIRNCLEDEVQLKPAHAKRSIQMVIELGEFYIGSLRKLLNGRYGNLFSEVVSDFVADPGSAEWIYLEYFAVTCDILLHRIHKDGTDLQSGIRAAFESTSLLDRLSAASLVLMLCYGLENLVLEDLGIDTEDIVPIATDSIDRLSDLLVDPAASIFSTASICWTMAWLVDVAPLTSEQKDEWAPILASNFISNTMSPLGRHSAWVLGKEQFAEHHAQIYANHEASLRELMRHLLEREESQEIDDVIVRMLAKLAVAGGATPNDELVRNFIVMFRKSRVHDWSNVVERFSGVIWGEAEPDSGG